MLYSIVYVSSAVKMMGNDELWAMLIKSRLNNAIDEITGVLMYCNGNIIQVLEGEQARVKNTYQRILTDPRHGQVIMLYSGRIHGRSFDMWTMGFHSLTAREMNELRLAVPFISNPYHKESPDQVISLLQNFYINNLRN